MRYLQDIQKFLDEAENGVIVVSFGSMIRPDIIPGLHDTLVAVFKNFKQRIVWKTPNAPKTLPSNVMASKWLPQSNVLGKSKALESREAQIKPTEAMFTVHE